jgi:hypothetical protein
MEIDKWIRNYKVRSFPWIDGKHIYFNVCKYAPGQSIKKSPILDRTVYITDDSAGRRTVQYFTDSLVEHIVNMKLSKDVKKVVITVPDNPIWDSLFRVEQ